MTREITALILLLAAASLVPEHGLAEPPAATNAPTAIQLSTPSGDAILAKGKGVEIRRSQLDEGVRHAKAQVEAKGRTVKPDQTVQVERQVLDQLINVQLVAAKARAADKAAGKALAEQRFAKASTQAGSEEAFDRQLKLMGTTRDEVLAKWTEALTGEAVLKREFKIKITDKDIKKFYEENPTQYDVKDTVRFRQILIATGDPRTGAALSADQKAAKRTQAEAVLKRARGGEDFFRLVSEFSDDTGSKGKGGEYTVVRGKMVPELEAAAFALNTNEISGVVTSTYGYHIIKLIEKIPAHKTDLATATPYIRDGLTQYAIQQQFPDYIAKLRKEAGVEILDERLKPQEPGPEPSFVPGAPTKRPG